MQQPFVTVDNISVYNVLKPEGLVFAISFTDINSDLR